MIYTIICNNFTSGLPHAVAVLWPIPKCIFPAIKPKQTAIKNRHQLITAKSIKTPIQTHQNSLAFAIKANKKRKNGKLLRNAKLLLMYLWAHKIHNGTKIAPLKTIPTDSDKRVQVKQEF